MNINIRFANKDDIPELTYLHIKLLELEGIKAKDEKNISWAFNEIINSQNTYIFLIEYCEKIVGMCTLHTLISSVEGGMLGLIEDVYVDEEYRKKRLGLSLMKEVERFCKIKNYKRLQLLCKNDNIRAIKFYEKLGFIGINRVFFYKKL